MTDEQNDIASSLILVMPGGKRVFIPPTTIPAWGLRGHVKRPQQSVSNGDGPTQPMGSVDDDQ